MKFRHRILPPLICCLFVSCAPYGEYFMSPAEVRANPYVTLPMAADSQRTITTAGLAFQVGGSNDGFRDNLVGGTVAIMQSHHFGHFQGYYGAGFGAGSYYHEAETFYPRYYTGYDTGDYHIPGGHRSFGYYGFNTGANVVVPFANGKGEWRAVGIDLAYRKEFGNYLSFRKKLNPEFVDLNAVYDHLFSIGGSTEIVGRSRRGTQVSYKLAVGGIIYPHHQYIGNPSGTSKPFYLSQTLAVTRQRVTGYLQITAGTRAFGIQTGVNVSLRRKTQAFPVFDRPVAERKPPRARRPHPPNPFRRRKIESGQ